MKAITLNLIGILLIAATSVYAQQNSLTGIWRVDLSSTLEIMEPSVKQKFDNLQSDVRARAEASMGGRQFSFLSSGAVTVSWISNGTEYHVNGTWKTSAQTLSITVDGDTQLFVFEVVAAQHLVLRSNSPSGLFSNLYLTWQP